MLKCKDTTIFTGISKYFKKNDAEKAFSAINDTIRCLRLSEKLLFGKVSKPNSKFSQWQVLQLLLLFPCSMVRNAYNYVSSPLSEMVQCHKDAFYRFLSNVDYDWRKIQYHISSQFWEKIQRRRKKSDKEPICLIFDDSDFPKSGKSAEMIGKVFSHVYGRLILGFKVLFCAITDGKSQMVLDEAIVGEKGKNENYGMKQSDLDSRFSKQREKGCVVESPPKSLLFNC